jgi:hypothetical protein
MTIERFAAENNLKTSRDECGDLIIRGKRGHLYVDDGRLCAMWLDAPPIRHCRLEELGGKCWQGDISPGAKGRRVQDAWVKGIALEHHQRAILLVGAKRKRVLSESDRATRSARAAGLTALRLQRQKAHSQSVESFGLEQVDVSLGMDSSDGF